MGSPLPFSLGFAEVGPAYHNPSSPVNAERLVRTGLKGLVALSMGDRPGRQEGLSGIDE